MRVSIYTQLVRVRLAISVVQEHGTGVDHIVFVLSTLLWLKLVISLINTD
jgi:hypothetical protein